MNFKVASRNKLHSMITGSLVFVPLEVVSCLSVLTKIPTSGMVIPPMLISQVKYFDNDNTLIKEAMGICYPRLCICYKRFDMISEITLSHECYH